VHLAQISDLNGYNARHKLTGCRCRNYIFNNRFAFGIPLGKNGTLPQMQKMV